MDFHGFLRISPDSPRLSHLVFGMFFGNTPQHAHNIFQEKISKQKLPTNLPSFLPSFHTNMSPVPSKMIADLALPPSSPIPSEDPSVTSKNSIQKLAQSVQDKVEQAIAAAKTHEGIMQFLKEHFQPSDKCLEFFIQQELNTIRAIAQFGDKDLSVLLTPFPVSMLGNHDFLQFVEIIHCLTYHFKLMAHDRREQDSAILSPNPKHYLFYLPNGVITTTQFLASINPNSLQRSIRFIQRTFKEELKDAMDTLLALVTQATDPHIGSTISTASKSSRGDPNNPSIQKQAPIPFHPNLPPLPILRVTPLVKKLVRKPSKISKNTTKTSKMNTIHQILRTQSTPITSHHLPKILPKTLYQGHHPNHLHLPPTNHSSLTPTRIKTTTIMNTMTGN